MAELVRIPTYVRVSGISKMAACNRKWIWNNVYISAYAWQQRNSNGYAYAFELAQIHIIAVVISLLNHVYTSWDIRPYPFPVSGRHLWFLTHPDIRQYWYSSHHVVRPNKYSNTDEISHMSYLQFQVHVRPVSRPPSDFQLNADRILHRAILLPANVNSAS